MLGELLGHSIGESLGEETNLEVLWNFRVAICSTMIANLTKKKISDL
jgi:hypothetical protein